VARPIISKINNKNFGEGELALAKRGHSGVNFQNEVFEGVESIKKSCLIAIKVCFKGFLVFSECI
jgi:hypothetical protein